jgi:uracil-DNA glycosylase
MRKLIEEIHNCDICVKHLPFPPKPIVQLSENASVLIIGQAPGMKVQQSGIAWDDHSGKRLRKWLGVSDATFYNADKIALVPMGFCYPGKGKTGDLPPRKECVPAWHDKVLNEMPNIDLTILIGLYAQKYYLKSSIKSNLTETVRAYSEYNNVFPLPHPSPRNGIWLKKHDWFEKEVVPKLQTKIKSLNLN